LLATAATLSLPARRQGHGPMLTFQQIILKLQAYWDAQGCALL
jgi:hypothetical protein